jgi:FixJ family two-component response regulator
MGFEVKTFPSAVDFLNQTSADGNGCLIVDVRMPGMSGLDLQQRLCDSGVELPVIFITAYEDAGVREQAIRCGALAFLQKPFSDQSLLDAIHAALSGVKHHAPTEGTAPGRNRETPATQTYN